MKEFMKKIIKILAVLSVIIGLSVGGPKINQANAACPTGYTCIPPCTANGQCVNNKVCEAITIKYTSPDAAHHKVIRLSNRSCGSAIIGKVEPPKGVFEYNAHAGGASGINIGILVFASKLLKLVNIAAGLLFFANFTMAGYTYITSAGNTNIMTEIKDKLTFSIVGIIIIVAAYTGAALFGYIFFGDPGIVLNPDLTKYGALAPPTP